MATTETAAETAITGCEAPGDPSAPRQALAQFYQAFNARDLTLMSKTGSPGDPKYRLAIQFARACYISRGTGGSAVRSAAYKDWLKFVNQPTMRRLWREVTA